jgi:hypothetical protein
MTGSLVSSIIVLVIVPATGQTAIFEEVVAAAELAIIIIIMKNHVMVPTKATSNADTERRTILFLSDCKRKSFH